LCFSGSSKKEQQISWDYKIYREKYIIKKLNIPAVFVFKPLFLRRFIFSLTEPCILLKYLWAKSVYMC
jgi:hypothetical protein